MPGAPMKKMRFGKTGLEVTRLALGGYPFAGVNRAQGWDPYTPDGEREAVRTIHAALDGGINYIDTAPGYGAGHSESLIGRVMRTRRSECYLATKVAYDGDRSSTIRSCEESLRRLQTDHVDVLQFHGGRFTEAQVDHILNGGPMEAMEELRRKGLARHIGFTVEEPWTALPLVASGRFEMVQVCYNLARQEAGYHLLYDARKADMGVCCMRPLTSGILQRQLEALAPHWLENGVIYRVLMAFLLSDSRVHMIPAGMRWAREVQENIAFVESFVPIADMAAMPRMTQHVYETDDARHSGEATQQ